MQVVIYLDTARRLVLYPEGGMAQQSRVPADKVGWTAADDEVWPDVLTGLELAETLARGQIDNEVAADGVTLKDTK